MSQSSKTHKLTTTIEAEQAKVTTLKPLCQRIIASTFELDTLHEKIGAVEQEVSSLEKEILAVKAGVHGDFLRDMIAEMVLELAQQTDKKQRKSNIETLIYLLF